LSGPIRGTYRDVLRDPGGRVLLDTGWHSNTIVHGCRILLAGLMRYRPDDPMNGQPPVLGIQELRVGQGGEDWDQVPPDDPSEETDSLENGYADGLPLGPEHFSFVTPSDDPISIPTSRLQITVQLGSDYPNEDSYPLREFGLFGTLGDGSEYMVNCVRHPLIQKGRQDTLTRTIQLYF